MNKVHIGYPKTGTTYLQKYIFTQLERHEFINHNKFINLGLFNLLWKIERSIDYDKIYKLLQNKKFFISFEEITGPSMQGAIIMDEIPLRLKKAFKEDVKVLITIRRQDALMKSLYLQYLHLGGTLKLRSLIDNKNYGQSRIESEAYNFYATYLKYCEVFGEDNVKIIPYELLIESPELFKDSLESFFEDEKFEMIKSKRVNRSVKGSQVRLLRFVNNFLSSWISEKYLIPQSFLNQDKFRKKLQDSNLLRFGDTINKKEDMFLKQNMERFYKSNRILDEKLKLNLKKYGYYK